MPTKTPTKTDSSKHSQQDFSSYIKNSGKATQAIRGGQSRTSEAEHSPPIFTTSSYVFKTAEEAAQRFSGESPGNIYSRFTNPTVKLFEQRLALMEGGERGIAFSSGMAAITALGMGLLKAGDHVLCSQSVFGNTLLLFQKFFQKFGVKTSFVALTDISAWQKAMTPETQLLLLETPSNPLTEIADITKLAELANANNAILAVDNVFCTPVLQNPLELGAHVVMHSATKYLDGHGRCVGGALVGSEDFIENTIYPFLRTGGATMSPFNAWTFLSGLETLDLRMKAHSESALELATWLEQQPQVKRVYYPGLKSHPQYELALKQQKTGGGILSFELTGGKDAAWKLVNKTRLLSITANLGDVKSTITHPASTTHSRLTLPERQAAGISDGLLRISTGLESIEDIKADLVRGL